MSDTQHSLSVIIPTYNMCEHLTSLAHSMRASGLLDAVTEVIWVDDASTDETRAVLRDLCDQYPERMKLVSLPTNQGRYQARLEGARAAAGSHLLFIDSRILLPPDFGRTLIPMLAHGCACVVVRIDTTKSLFNLYWDRTHALIFRHNLRNEREGFYVTDQNYDEFVTGTTTFLSPRDQFLAACAKFGDRQLRSDDTLLLREIAKHHSIYVKADWFIWWEPRQTFGSFLERLWERGPGFAEYHVLVRRGLYFYVLLGCAAYLVAGLVLSFYAPTWGFGVLMSIPLGLIATTAAFARGPLEFARMVPLHLLVCAVAAVSAVRGTFVCLADARKAAR